MNALDPGGGECGQGLTEYAVVAILVATVVLLAVRLLGASLGIKYCEAAAAVALVDAASCARQPAAAPPPASNPPPPRPAAPPPPTPTPAGFFKDPTVDGFPVDRCLFPPSIENCGQPAADSFCRSQGFERATSFGIGTTSISRTPGSDVICGVTAGFTQCNQLTFVQCAS